jgi:uncharacterized membrane protein YqjE
MKGNSSLLAMIKTKNKLVSLNAEKLQEKNIIQISLMIYFSILLLYMTKASMGIWILTIIIVFDE